MNKELTKNELSFINETKWTVDMYEFGYDKWSIADTAYCDLDAHDAGIMYEIILAQKYDIDVHKLYDKLTDSENN